MDKNLLVYATQSSSINGDARLYQNSLEYKQPPAFCTKPYFYISNGLIAGAGPTKTVRVADDDYNYIDYLEAHLGFDCYTYRSRDVLDKIDRQIMKSFEKIENARCK